MFTITKEFHFSASHVLDRLPSWHPCARMHGHNYVVVLELSARPDQLTEAGFAGFRVMDPDAENDWLAVLGAAYFRTSGWSGQFGLSARGLAIDAGGPGPEEFPRFSRFWLEQAPAGGVVIYALLEGPRVTGGHELGAALEGQRVAEERAHGLARGRAAHAVSSSTGVRWLPVSTMSQV